MSPRSPFRAVLGAILLATMCAPCTAAGKGKAPPPPKPIDLGWAYPPLPLRVQVVHGLWTPQYRLEEAFAEAGAAPLHHAWVRDGTGSGWLSPGHQGKGGINMLSGADTDWMRYGVAVVAHSNAHAFGKRRQMMVDYVKNGGALFFLGGRFAFGKQYRESEFAEICPVAFPSDLRWNGSDLTFHPEGLVVKPGPAAAKYGLDKLDWSKAPKLYWIHKVEAKPGAEVLLVAGDMPVLAVGDVDKGRVAVFAGSVMGAPAEGNLPFWEWDGMPKVFGAVLRHLGDKTKQAPHGIANKYRAEFPEPGGSLGDLDELEGGLDGDMRGGAVKDSEALSADDRVFLAGAARCHGKDGAAFLLERLDAVRGDIQPETADALGAAVWPHGDKSLLPLAEKLLKSGQPNKTVVALFALAGSRDPSAYSLAAEFHQSGKPRGGGKKAGQSDDGDPFGNMGMAADPDQMKKAASRNAERIRDAARFAMALTDGAKARAILGADVKRLAPDGRIPEKTYPDILTPENRIYESAVLSSLIAGNRESAADAVRMMLNIHYVIARARTEKNKVESDIERAHAALPATLAWREELWLRWNRVPEEALPAACEALAAQEDRRVAFTALALFAGREVPPPAKPILAKSPVPAVRALANRGE